MQKQFWALGGQYAERVKNGEGLLNVVAQTKKDRDAEYRVLKAQGKRVFRGSLPGSLRQYWAMGEECGLVATSYYLQICE